MKVRSAVERVARVTQAQIERRSRINQARMEAVEQLNALEAHHERVLAEHARQLTLLRRDIIELVFAREVGRAPSVDEASFFVGLLEDGLGVDEVAARARACAPGASRA